LKKLLILILLIISIPAFSAVEKTGVVSNVQIWGGIAKAAVCSSNNTCVTYWVSLSDTKGNSGLSMWLTAKVSQSPVYIQGYAPDNDSHPYSGASKFYGMTVK
jgi:hypothetical protein